MNEKVNKGPDIRFVGYIDDWEQRKLGDLLDVSTGKLDANAMVEDGEYDFYTSGIKKYRIDVPAFEGPAITIAGNGATVGYMHLADGKFNAYQRTYVLEGFQADRQFLYSEIGNKLPRKIAEEARTGNIPYIVMDMLTDLNITLPVKEEEQRRIGSFFSNLDNLITLHQRNYDLLLEQKKGMMQKLFPRSGKCIPELRFEDFKEPWKKCKLGSITERVQGNDGRMDLPTLTISASSGWLDQRDRFSGNIAGNEQKNYTLLKAGELSYNHGNSKLAKYGVVYSLKTHEEALVPRVYHSFKIKKNNSADFIEELFATKLPDKELGKLISSGARMDGLLNIGYDEFMGIEIIVPSYEEQMQIANCLGELNESIILQFKALEHIKEIKKSMLQKMFV